MNYQQEDHVILLTGTITPNTFSDLTIKDPEIRRKQYLEALIFYLKKTEFKIVFAENSGDPLQNFPLNPDRIEYLSFLSFPIKPDRGKAFKEMEIIEFALQNSKFLKDAKSVVKITGRLKVLNIKNLSRKFLKNKRIRINIVSAYAYAINNMDARCFFFSLDFWPNLKYEGGNLAPPNNFEKSLWNAIFQYQRLEGNNFIPLNTPLRIKGKSGAFGHNYKHNLLIHYARLLRYLVLDRWWNRRYYKFKN